MLDTTKDIERFRFKSLHPDVFFGTASDRYAGWIGQIYSKERFAGKAKRRHHTVGGKSFVEEILPVESVEEYFQHFGVLEIDYTFYRPLLDKDGKPTNNYRVLENYRSHMNEGDRLILKAPQMVFAQKVRRKEGFVENEDYLNPRAFTEQFYKPANDILGGRLAGIIFEQEYQRKKERTSPEEAARELDEFFGEIPRDDLYHVELRTETLLTEPVFAVFEKHGIGQVLSHWTWLPSLSKQFAASGKRFLNSGGQCVIRLMTPRGMRYEEAYAKAHPFDRMVEGMMDSWLVEDTVRMMWSAVAKETKANIIINNRAGGNAPLIAQEIANRFVEVD